MEKEYSMFLKRFAIVFTFVILFVALVNIIVDPYAIFRFVEKENFNKEKASINHNTFVPKVMSLNRIKPDILVMGTSRASIGIDPTHKLIKGDDKRSFNFSVGSASVEELFLTVKYVNGINKLKKVVFGLDMLSFNAYRGVRKTFTKDEVVLKNTYLNKHAFNAVFSLNSFKASLETVRKQGRPKNLIITDKGHVGFNEGYVNAKKGHRDMFLSTERDYLKNNWYPLPHNKFAFVNDERDVFKSFKEMLEYLREENIEIYFYISPVHARLMELMKIDDIYDDFEDWKKALVYIAESDNKLHEQEQQLKIYDFAYYNKYTKEEVPLKGDRKTQMQWYWEDSHFRKELGDKIIDRIFKKENSEKDFGVLLTKENIESHLKSARNEGGKYEKKNFKDIEELKRIYKKYKK